MKDKFNIGYLLKCNEEEQKFYLRYLSRCSIETRIEIMKNHKVLLYKLKNNYNKEVNVLSYCALILSIEFIYSENKNLDKLNFESLSFDEIREVTSKRAKIFLSKEVRVKTQREKLLGYWAIVKTLRECEKFSLRQISNYLLKKHKFKVSHTLIYSLWKEIEEGEIDGCR